MRKSKFSESKIVALLKEAEAGRKVSDICREHGMSSDTFYQWLTFPVGLYQPFDEIFARQPA
ncbi:Transposase [Marinobacterium sp. xm-d-420]|nr:Transposase [Marinobacterium sp. xm-d-420]